MEIRFGKATDVQGITDIFNYYIENTNARFEESPFTVDNRQKWFSQFMVDSKYQIYVAVDNAHVLGFVCSQPYSALEAFNSTVEVTVYLSPEATGKGLGSTLYKKLFSVLSNQGVH